MKYWIYFFLDFSLFLCQVTHLKLSLNLLYFVPVHFHQLYLSHTNVKTTFSTAEAHECTKTPENFLHRRYWVKSELHVRLQNCFSTICYKCTPYATRNLVISTERNQFEIVDLSHKSLETKRQGFLLQNVPANFYTRHGPISYRETIHHLISLALLWTLKEGRMRNLIKFGNLFSSTETGKMPRYFYLKRLFGHVSL